MPPVYDELRRIAAGYMRRERPGQTLQATALVNEAFIRLASEKARPFASRTHFLAIAARSQCGEAPAVDLLVLDEALTRLAALDPELARIVELRYFAGLTIEETAEAIGRSPATVKRQWIIARLAETRHGQRVAFGPSES